MITGNKPRKISQYWFIDHCGEGVGATEPKPGEELWGIPCQYYSSDQSASFIEHRENGVVTKTANVLDVSFIVYADEREAVMADHLEILRVSEPRFPKKGDWIQCEDGSIRQINIDCNTDKVPIVLRYVVDRDRVVIVTPSGGLEAICIPDGGAQLQLEFTDQEHRFLYSWTSLLE